MKRIRLGPLSHLLPFHHPVELAHRIAYLDHMAEGRYQEGVGIGVLPTDHSLSIRTRRQRWAEPADDV
jgi:alkanesulfonate monooxygenase SsuD/methylene tetrahydromethanopterin reductase-like flavin-dependent oxidoreductase (luciferase family)